jgi:hypothetical protein
MDTSRAERAVPIENGAMHPKAPLDPAGHAAHPHAGHAHGVHLHGDHLHGDHRHTPRVAAPAAVRPSLLRLSLAGRLAIAAGLLVPLWIAVFLVVGGP